MISKEKLEKISTYLWVPILVSWFVRLPTLIFIPFGLVISVFLFLSIKMNLKKPIKVTTLFDAGILIWNTYLIYQGIVYATGVLSNYPEIIFTSPLSF